MRLKVVNSLQTIKCLNSDKSVRITCYSLMSLENNPNNIEAPVVATTAADVQKGIKQWRESNQKIAFVPTMGNLHEGHLALVEAAFKLAEHVIVSIFVNPTQFGENEDFDTYPRTFDEDTAKLANLGVDMIFAPSTDVIYPELSETSRDITVAALSDILEGEFRPGFFTGVATVVNKLFNIVTPDIAVFGEKDYQQLLVIKKMVADFNMPIDVRSVVTVREADGLAMSSRNGYLQPDQRQQASDLYKILQQLVLSVQADGAIKVAEELAIEQLQQKNFKVDYVCVRRQDNLLPALSEDAHLIVLAAVRLGETRLIDNIQFQVT